MNKTTYAILTLMLNAYGATSFMNGDKKKGIKTILSAVVTLGIVGVINAFKGIFLAVKIFKLSDEEFAANKATLEDAIVFFNKK